MTHPLIPDDGYTRLGELHAILGELLKTLPKSTLIVMSKDGEGNGFSPLSETDGIGIAMYLPRNTYAGYRYMTEADRLATGNPEDYDKAPDDAVRAVFLWPTN